LDIWTATRQYNAKKNAELVQSNNAGVSELPPELFQHANRIIQIEFTPVNIEFLNPIIGQRPEILNRNHGRVAKRIEILTVQNWGKL
jgi:hypothetical protein